MGRDVRFQTMALEKPEDVAPEQAHEIFLPIDSQARRVSLYHFLGVFIWMPR